MNETQNQIIDSENYRNGQEGQSYKDIVLRQLSRVVSKCSEEMRAGVLIYSTTPHQSQQVIRYLGDTRKELVNSLDTLHDLLLPKFDSTMTKNTKKVYEELIELKKEKLTPEEAQDKKLSIYRKLFQEICLFLERFGWLESSDVEDI
jgi:hypothetical protein